MTSTKRVYQRTFPVSPDGNPFVHNDLGLYTHNHPTPPSDVAERRAYLVGSGIGALLAAAFLVRDGRMPGRNITILEQLPVPGGSFDGAGDTGRGFITRGGREMGQHFECFWDIMREIPALEMPAPYTVLDEFRTVNENDPNIDPCRIIHHRGKRRDAYRMGVGKKGQRAVVRLLMAREEDTFGKTIEDWFDADFLASNFYTLFKTMFAFQQYESLTEMKRYMHRFLQYLPGFSDLSCLRFSRYNQFESFIVPLVDWLKGKGVVLQYDTCVDDLEMTITSGRKVVNGILFHHADGGRDRIDVAEKDFVLATIGSCTESTGYGDMDTVPPFHTDRPGGAWTLWRNLARKSAVFGRPDVFCSDPHKTVWESASFSFMGADHPFLGRIRELTGNDPLSGRTVTGGIITAEDSGWCLSLTMNRQPQFRSQPADWGGRLGLRALSARSGQLRAQADDRVHGRGGPQGVLLPLRSDQSVRPDQGAHFGAPGHDALHHLLLHASSCRRPPRGHPGRVRQPRSSRPVRRDARRLRLHDRGLCAHRDDGRLRTARSGS